MCCRTALVIGIKQLLYLLKNKNIFYVKKCIKYNDVFMSLFIFSIIIENIVVLINKNNPAHSHRARLNFKVNTTSECGQWTVFIIKNYFFQTYLF